MKNLFACISFFIVFLSFFDFFRDGKNLFFDESITIENMDAFEDASSADEDDEKEFVQHLFFLSQRTFHYDSSRYFSFSHLTVLHSPPPKVSVLI
jgi:hypothetical protein